MQIDNLKKDVQKNSNLKKYILIGLILAVTLLIILLVVVVLYSSMKPKPLTVFIDGSAANYTQDTFIFNEDKVYVSLKDIAGLIGYRYYDGGYKEFTQDKSKCYLESADEIVVYELGQNKIYKTLNNGTIEYSEFEISEPVMTVEGGNKLYIIATALRLGCNLNFEYNAQQNQIVINTLSNLYETYNKNANDNKYNNANAVDNDFNNKKLILRGALIVKDTSREKYGIISLDGTQTFLDIKYDEIKFIENFNQLIVKGENKYGIVSIADIQNVKLPYDKLTILDNTNKLYYVEDSGKKGIITLDGNPLGELAIEYDEIGIDTKLTQAQKLVDSIIIYDKCILAKKDNVWKIYDLEGEAVSLYEWEEIGYIEDDSNNNIVLLPDIEGIVVSNGEKYGIINAEGRLLVDCIYDKIYSETLNGEAQYYLVEGEDIRELEDCLN